MARVLSRIAEQPRPKLLGETEATKHPITRKAWVCPVLQRSLAKCRKRSEFPGQAR